MLTSNSSGIGGYHGGVKNVRVVISSLLVFAACSSGPSLVATPGAIGFDSDLVGWQAGSTGGTGEHASWEQGADKAPVSMPNVLAITSINHKSESRFNLFWTEQLRFQDGSVAVAVRADDGVIDQGGGPMWRVQDQDNYYVCRFNPLEANYRVYVVEGGVRRQLGTALAAVTAGKWHRIEVQHAGDHIQCWLDGQKLLDVHDGTIPHVGGVGLWTKADARTSFDDLLVNSSLVENR